MAAENETDDEDEGSSDNEEESSSGDEEESSSDDEDDDSSNDADELNIPMIDEKFSSDGATNLSSSAQTT
ncbi:unnamed protein product [Rotaria sp. Silwood2]|nr:unnamed protein product [Rotaria sp. Silwood2]CAF3330180.1 unnamed protein product [Rotaria sp. Silwood2]CAF4229830.1 unnamed protein product [Rotaria sp. Silwood2]CAF4332771.1 unnamed protein product [Rotaria sp. Silwood2]CAF4380194.1 unnamed protein product [Rotaria sp. Silwood2]